nr:uncharacterized protein LOC123760257 isoform X2 [Procambarus clarkii]
MDCSIFPKTLIECTWSETWKWVLRKKKKKVMQASLSGQLSHYGQYFVSGFETLRDGGWYKLVSVLPPAQIIQRQMTKKQGGKDTLRHR